LTKPKARMSWEKEFPAGAKMVAGLTSVLADIKNGRAERDVYADFLDEASRLLNRPALNVAATHFRRSGDAWMALSQALLPDEIRPFRETRELMRQRQRLFLERGNVALDEVRQIEQRLAAIKAEITAGFPLDAAGVQAMRQNIANHVLAIHDIEQEAVAALKAAMSSQLAR
jgi:hypothetical protein